MLSPNAPLTREEVDRWAHQRRPDEREAVPVPGERLLFREHTFGDVVPAVVAQVQDLTVPNDQWGVPGAPPDAHVWDLDEATRQYRLKDDPWPWVAVQVVLQAGPGDAEVLAPPRWCKEARVRGSAGWLRPGTRAHHGNYEEGA